jgi:ferredoxin
MKPDDSAADPAATPARSAAPESAGRFVVQWRATGQRFDAAADETVLAAGLRAGVPMPSSCRNGSCRACIARLASGDIRYCIEWPGLSAEEKRDGLILPCAAYATSDLVIERA